MNSLQLILSTPRYFAPAWVFASLNILVGTWVLYIPYVKEKLALDDGQVGIALFFFALGTLSMISISPAIIGRVGLGRTTLAGIVVLSMAFLLPLSASSYPWLCCALYVAGLFACLTDIAMNALVSEIEQEDGVHFMSASHGFFSLGGVIGGGIGSLVITWFEVPLTHMVWVIAGVILANMLLAKAYLNIPGKKVERQQQPFKIGLLKPLLGLTMIAFLIMGSEGAIEHWSKLYLQEVVLIASERTTGLGFVIFSATMTLGRFFGDAVSKRYGATTIIIGGCLISMLGFLSILMAELIPSLIGFGLVGLGFSVIIPELFRLAGKTKGVSSAEGISFVAGFGYVGFLISPAFLGFLSRMDSLKLSFTALLVAAGVAMAITIFLKKRSLKGAASVGRR
ncbi:MAG: MFS transporter [Lewinellaceae bacterium]|nr:MFS transporter [Phaeodactylibacter sp.]MCB9041984.1 MFS transporter [Lewinellaceae bacterium]